MLASHIVCIGRTPNCDNKELLQSDLSGKFLFYQMNVPIFLFAFNASYMIKEIPKVTI